MFANMRGGGVRQGGSTITQQLAKTNFLSGDRTIKRKAQEVIIAFWLEAWLTKQEILSRYLSSVYFGDGVYGLRAAAHHYFNRDPDKLTLAQSAMLAGMVQAPSRLAPTQHLAPPRSAASWCSRRWPTPARSARARAARRGSARPVARTVESPDRHLFRRLGGALCAAGVRCRLRRSAGRDDARPRPPAARGPGGRPGGDRRCAGRAGRDAARRPRRRDGRRQELQPNRPSTESPRRGGSRARRSNCSSISLPCAPAGRPTA